MDQYAHALVERTTGAVLVEQPPEIAAALDASGIPVLAPYRWLRSVDPLPHTWDASSDNVAAWIAGVVGARRIVLIKAARRDQPKALDPAYLRALPAGMDSVVLSPNELEKLGDALDQSPIPHQQRTVREG